MIVYGSRVYMGSLVMALPYSSLDVQAWLGLRIGRLNMSHWNDERIKSTVATIRPRSAFKQLLCCQAGFCQSGPPSIPMQQVLACSNHNFTLDKATKQSTALLTHSPCEALC